MPNATYQQPNFLGGEWSPYFQGRSDHPKYKTAMNLSRNGLPLEEGAWTRRPGSRLVAPTRKGQSARLYPVFFTDTAPYTAEFTDTTLRFFNNCYPVITQEFTGVSTISTATPAVMTLAGPTVWSAGDEVGFYFSTITADQGQNLRGRVFTITPVAETYPAWSNATTYGIGDIITYSGVTYSSAQADNLNKQPDLNPAWWTAFAAGATRKYSLTDSVTGLPLDGSTVSIGSFLGLYVLRGLRLTTPYAAGQWETARIVQNQDIALVVNGLNKPQALKITPNAGWAGAATASIKDCRFLDGPYLDPIKGSIASVSGTSGVVTITVNFATWSITGTYAIGDYVKYGTKAYKALTGANIGNQPDISPTNWQAADLGVAVTGPGSTTVGFQATDVGRLLRLFSEPAVYNSGTNYAAGVTVTFNGLYYTTIQPVSNVQPDTDATKWSINPSAAVWTWAQITAVTNTNTVSAQIMGAAIPWTGVDINTWRLGVYSDTTGYPTCGVFCEGRFWLGGAQPNRFDTTVASGGILGLAVDQDGNVNMAPTSEDGTVTDAHAISYTLESDEQDPIFWFANDHLGILAGTAGGEWLISASQLNDPFTPTSIQARRVTKYKAADIEPRRTGIALIFVQKFARRIMEFVADVFTGRFSAPHLTETAKHLTQAGVAEIQYQEELAPVLWVRAKDGTLKGATYRRVSAFTSEAPAFVGWHRHDLGHGRTLTSTAVGPNQDGSLDALSMVTTDGTHNFVEQLTQLFDEDDNILDAFFLDGAIVPDAYIETTIGGKLGLQFTGLWYLAGKTVTAFICGLDCGDLTVDANGALFVPYGSGVDPGKYDYTLPGAGAWKFTQAYVNSVLALNRTNRNGSVNVSATETISSKTINVNPNGSTSKILSYIPVEGIRHDNLCLDWGTDNIMFVKSGSTAFVKMNADSGVEAGSYDIGTILGLTPGASTLTNNLSGADVDNEGHVYFVHDSGNYGPLAKVLDTTMTKVFDYGTSSTFGPPQTPGAAFPAAMCVAEANAPWVIIISTTRAITFNNGTTGTFLAGNGSNQTGFMGVNQTPWQLESNGGFLDAGAATYQNNVASGYVVQAGSGFPATIAYFFIGVADGVPVYASNTVNPGSTGKKGKGKKGASDGGVTHTPTVDNPLEYFAKIGTLAATAIHPMWAAGFSGIQGSVVDFSDNSVIAGVTAEVSTWQSAYSALTAYNFDTTAYTTWTAGTYQPGDVRAGPTLTNNLATLWKVVATAPTTVNPEAVGQADWAINGAMFIAYDNTKAYVAGDYVLGSDTIPYKSVAGSTGLDPAGHTAYSAATTYALNDFAVFNGIVYQSIQAGNLANQPDTSPLWWTAIWDVITTKTLANSIVKANGDPLYVYPKVVNVINQNPTVIATDTFPKSGTYWQQLPNNYIVAYTTGQYSRSNTGTAGLKWAVPVPVLPGIGTAGAQGRVHGGLFGFASYQQDTAGHLSVWMIDTTTGKYFVGDVPGVHTTWGVQLWDDVTQSLIFADVTYDNTVPGCPTGVNGTVSFGAQWARLWCGNLTPSTGNKATLTTQPSTYTFIFNTSGGGGIPAVVGYTFTSQGQILRAVLPQDAGARNGPALGKTRRSHIFMALLKNTLGISFGTEFTTKGMVRAFLKNEQTGKYTPPDAPFSGIWRDSLEDTYGFDSMMGWQITRPYPASVVSVEVGVKTQDV